MFWKKEILDPHSKISFSPSNIVITKIDELRSEVELDLQFQAINNHSIFLGF